MYSSKLKKYTTKKISNARTPMAAEFCYNAVCNHRFGAFGGPQPASLTIHTRIIPAIQAFRYFAHLISWSTRTILQPFAASQNKV